MELVKQQLNNGVLVYGTYPDVHLAGSFVNLNTSTVANDLTLTLEFAEVPTSVIAP